ncbi:MAG: hypothetical protein K0Q50_2949 [Vampirovibrio sp.]|jgi:hypothetical protein|nr:hypothetical protein [Vampirovibrio sp.]
MLTPVPKLSRRASDPTGQLSRKPPDYPPPPRYGEHQQDTLEQSSPPPHKAYNKWLQNQHAAFRKQHPNTPDTEDAFDCFLQKHNTPRQVNPDTLLDPFEQNEFRFILNAEARRRQIAFFIAPLHPQEARMQLAVSRNRQRAYEFELENQPSAFQRREMNRHIRYEQELQAQLQRKIRATNAKARLQRFIIAMFMLGFGYQVLKIFTVPQQNPPPEAPSPSWPNSSLPDTGWPGFWNLEN